MATLLPIKERTTNTREEQLISHKHELEITDDSARWLELAERYEVPVEEVALIDFNRSGVALPNGEVPVNFRVRFKGILMDGAGGSSWYALPVRSEGDTNFVAIDDGLQFGGRPIGTIESLMLDTCEASYQRGPHLLNLNSRSRSNCGGCRACVHNYKNLYDETVIRDQDQLMTEADLEAFFDAKTADGLDVAALQQIAVVTGLFGSEQAVVDHMKLVAHVAAKRGFAGELMYFGCEVNSEAALEELAGLGNFALVYAIDNFTHRDRLLTKTKSLITLEDARRTLELAKSKGIATNFAYIAGLDPIEDMTAGFTYLRDSLTRFPIVNVYQVQTTSQVKAMDPAAKGLEYYVQARKAIESAMQGSDLLPVRWENYRPLWYNWYDGEPLATKPYGD
ncbi:hypothetical protein IPM09_04980 [Candidatus Saccharibacteria bacterium]|nr:MAG: hypothetical protein IPM09_04980 [Candidatus Saccharibacteria bacterium]